MAAILCQPQCVKNYAYKIVAISATSQWVIHTTKKAHRTKPMRFFLVSALLEHMRKFADKPNPESIIII